MPHGNADWTGGPARLAVGASGIATRIDTAADKIDVAQGGVIYRTPTIRTAAGIAALKTFKAGDMVTLLFTEPTAVEIKPMQ